MAFGYLCCDMKRYIFPLCISLMLAFQCVAGAQDIKLPAADQKRPTLQVSEALASRHSVREYDTRALSMQDLSDVCWAACGMSRDTRHRTAPTARNLQEIRLFVFDQNAVYEYIAKDNCLKHLVAGDHRDLIAGGPFTQKFVMDAPVSLLMVIDFDIYGSHDERALKMGCVDAGNVSENINLFCEAAGLVTVPRASMDIEGICKLLGFTQQQLPIMNNPVGYSKKK